MVDEKKPDSKPRYNFAIPDDSQGAAPRKNFGSTLSYQLHYMPVLLHERDLRTELQRKQYNLVVEHETRVQSLGGDTYSVDIKLKGDNPSLDGSMLIPRAGFKVSIHFKNARNVRLG